MELYMENIDVLRRGYASVGIGEALVSMMF